MQSSQQQSTQSLVFDENMVQKKENNGPLEESASQRQWVPTEHLENKENWDPEMGVFVGGTRFSTPVGGKKKGLTARRPLGELKVPLHPSQEADPDVRGSKKTKATLVHASLRISLLALPFLYPRRPPERASATSTLASEASAVRGRDECGSILLHVYCSVGFFCPSFGESSDSDSPPGWALMRLLHVPQWNPPSVSEMCSRCPLLCQVDNTPDRMIAIDSESATQQSTSNAQNVAAGSQAQAQRKAMMKPSFAKNAIRMQPMSGLSMMR